MHMYAFIRTPHYMCAAILSQSHKETHTTTPSFHVNAGDLASDPLAYTKSNVPIEQEQQAQLHTKI